MAYRTLVASLDSLFLHDNGALDEEVAVNLLTARLVYPRPGIASRTSVKSIDLDDGVERTFSRSPFSERILFKERIQGRTEIGIEISVQLPAARIPGLVQAILSGAAGAGLAVLGDLAAPLVSAAGRRGARDLSRGGLRDDRNPETFAVIGSGRTELESEELTAEGAVVRNLELVVPRTLSLRRTRPEMERDPELSGRHHDHYRATREELRLEAGDAVGWVNLKLAAS